LRAQIARISAATVISPNGYYKFDEEEEEGSGGSQSIVLNTEFEWPTNDTLLQTENWVHHVPYILPQGRVVWVDTTPKVEKKEEDGEEEKENEDKEEEENSVEAEVGPPILSPISEDRGIEDIPAWTSKISTTLSPIKYAPVALRSNIWPGAYAIGYNDKFANIYIGYGLKDLQKKFELEPEPPVEEEEEEVVDEEQQEKKDEDNSQKGEEEKPSKKDEEKEEEIQEAEEEA
jgi:radial spoke head protein 4A